MNPDVLLMVALGMTWLTAAGLLWIVWRLHQRLAQLEAPPEPLRVDILATVDEYTWAAVTDAFRDTHTDMEVTPS